MISVKDSIGAGTAVLVCEAVGLVSGVFTASALPLWYSGLAKSALTPPGWVFAPVWTLLYALMGIAAFLVWRKGFERPKARAALLLFTLQLVLNAAWSVMFFGLKNPALALGDILLLWLAVVGTVVAFFKISRTAGALLLPYLLWTSFALYLNFMIVVLN